MNFHEPATLEEAAALLAADEDARPLAGGATLVAMMNADLDSADDPDTMTRAMIAASPLAAAWDRMIDPEEIAASVLFLVSDQSAMITGTSIGIDGGKSLGVPPRTA